MRTTRIASARAATLIVSGALSLAAGACARSARHDPLRAEITRWSAAVAADTASDRLSRGIRASAGPPVERAKAALEAGHREIALYELSRAMPLLDAARYVAGHPAAAASTDALEAEWKRMDGVLAPAPRPGGEKALARIRAALPGALAEAAWPQVRIYYDASLDYGRSTEPVAGLFYLGQALAQQRFVAFAESLEAIGHGRLPAFRGIAGELDDLESEILSAYRPPASIHLHAGFIAAASALKEARELDALGLHRGALLRYLQGSLRAQAVIPSPPRFDPTETPARLDAFAARIESRGTDHGIARLFLDLARADAGDTTAGATHAVAAAVAGVVLPRYFAVLEPAAARPAKPEPKVTVTLVRWPYT